MTTKRLVSIAIFTALIVLGGFISVPIPFTQVEISLQVMFVIMAGLVLGGRDGALAVLVYIAMGLLGLPVFTQGGGVAYVFKPSFGYLIGFPIGAFVSGVIASRAKKGALSKRSRIFVAALVGMLPIYIIGASYQVLILYYYVGSSFGAVVAGLPAIAVLAVKDAVLCGLVVSVYPALERAVGNRSAKKKDKPIPTRAEGGAISGE